jgi:hypothetical protein
MLDEKDHHQLTEKKVRMSIVSENGFIHNKQKTIELNNTKRDLEKMLDRDAENENKTLESARTPQKLSFPEPVPGQPMTMTLKESATAPRRSESKRKSNIFSRQKSSKTKNIVNTIVRGWWWTTIIGCFTVYTLFSDDLKEICFEPTVSPIFDIMVYICMGFFTLEIVLSLINGQDYFLSFYFYLDIISTISMILDLSYFSQTSLDSVDSLNNILRSAKTAKIGSRAGRIVRMFRIVGIFRLSKIFKEAEKVKQTKIENFDKDLKRKEKKERPKPRRSKSSSPILRV